MPRNRRPRSSDRSKPAPPSQLRIIGGRWRGRKVAFAPIEGLRPTGDRLRETLFNWLQFHLPGARCLDLFAGSGALGLEALSRGAAAVDFVELDRGAAQMLRQQLDLLQAEGGRVHNCPAEVFLSQATGAFDIIFVDPPFAGDLWQSTLAGLIEAGCVAEGTLIYVESPRDTRINAPAGWQLEKEKQAGQVCLRLFAA
ncbi:16S rRNA (guanine(966)-N(2))-methyltransferase RsmD [Microbulbifer hydrolyticus]|uniref:Ribosomal RNA small subunit methyltransferase D n=1 Tax=Microbulbifer hydrolyticus TaxID=48074 RepID=A0A6P1T7H2_9GAMM|nr:16S rRNA (guanine(966)-N(2))-methyltransferase RsmD [Microbulbifer hydrolyticus]MBB5211646.1 16S rRNA (guanine966-N2)-methyltransferase [Microbulbifer hydrolyticus]QHQ37620.1 16S rRNA (guanine(966)-N(2))-methyltransferase RsmD [Microbulbifer hydrolyticus]